MITLTEQELQHIIDRSVQTAVQPVVAATLKNLGIPTDKDWLWITQAEATRMLKSRRKLEKAMRMGKIDFEKVDMDSRQGRVLVRLSDVLKLLKQPA